MKENIHIESQLTLTRLNELLEYVHHLGSFNQKPMFSVDEHKQIHIWEHQVKGKVGISHNVIDDDGTEAWLKIERLKRIPPPLLPNQISLWVNLSTDPECTPSLKEKIIKTMGDDEVQKLLSDGVIKKSDVMESIGRNDANLNLKDVVFRLSNHDEVNLQFKEYMKYQWTPWSEEEKPRRETIKLYDSLFSFQQTIEAQVEGQPIELIWGIGIARWDINDRKIDIPLIEKCIEIELNNIDSSILIRPRRIDPSIAVDAFLHLDNFGAENLLSFGKKYLADLSEHIEFSPYNRESFEPILRQAATFLSENGIYWPDLNQDTDNRQPNKIGETLEITDSWIIFARPKSASSFNQDIERFKNKLENEELLNLPATVKRLVTEHSNTKSLQFLEGVFCSENSSDFNHSLANSMDLYFPKPFNDAQKEIIYKLEINDGVVVQGPPGTGKTHTIANIICHYLATGKSVLVTSKGEPALSVLQEQIPADIRKLTISMLTSERQGMKQFESAIQLLAGLIAQNNFKYLNSEASSKEQQIKQLQVEIDHIDQQIAQWAKKQLKPIDKSISGVEKDMTAMELAQQVVEGAHNHAWLKDKLGASGTFDPKFSDSDIREIRDARRRLGADITYVDKLSPSVNDLPDIANIMSMHADLANLVDLSSKAKIKQLPILSLSENNSIQRAEALIAPLKQLSNIQNDCISNEWFKFIFNAWANDISNHTIDLYEELFSELELLAKNREQYVKTAVYIQEHFSCESEVNLALERLAANKKAFGILSFGSNAIKNIIDAIRINSKRPESIGDWQTVLNYIKFQNDMRSFITKWNHIGDELCLPKLQYTFGDSFKDIQLLHEKISTAKVFVQNRWKEICKELIILFPYGINIDHLLHDSLEVKTIVEAIHLNISSARLGLQKLKLQDLMNKIKDTDSDIAIKIKDFLLNIVGNVKYTSNDVGDMWQGFISEICRVNGLIQDLEIISNVSEKISGSGAPEWASLLKKQPLISSYDALTPDNWYETWQWKRRFQYICDIDGRAILKQLSEKREQCDSELKKAFSDLVCIKTKLGLHTTMTERVQGALMRFVAAVAKIGKGIGKRAPRHKRDAYNAMQDCFGGVPCWIMPTWRISESLPSDFGLFDLVIIDEASQSDIMAISAIMRAKKILVVGDDKQVSPTSDLYINEERMLQLKRFLKRQAYPELFLPGASLYNLANVLFPSTRVVLVEHFRCVEPIIRFSMQFYNEDLIPLRIPKLSERINPPLVDVFVKNGRRDENDINILEAEAILAEIKNIISDPKFHNRSIGVISLIGVKQAKYIQELLLNQLGEDLFEKHKIACGNAATFQGKEKDIIFLSMVVGPKQGAVLNKLDNQQRFNVALSRARDRMYLYRSIEENELTNESDLRLKVLRHFTNPMPSRNIVDNPLELCHPAFERPFAKKLLDMNYNVTPQVKVGNYSIDLVVEGENDRRLAIELDGDKYHPPEQWLSDWNRQRTMERIGWKFWRCWGSSYTLDPDGCINDLITVLNYMQIYPCKQSELSSIYSEYRVYEDENKVYVDDSDQSLGIEENDSDNGEIVVVN